jgi:cytochrome c556
MKLKVTAVILCFVALALAYRCSADAEQQPSKVTSIIMKEKLKSSQTMLEGIALADFKKVIASAEELIKLTKTEEWMVYKTPKYEMHSNEFRRAAENVIAKAKLKNIDGVTLAYFELTVSCVRCHTYVREIRDAEP